MLRTIWLNCKKMILPLGVSLTLAFGFSVIFLFGTYVEFMRVEERESLGLFSNVNALHAGLLNFEYDWRTRRKPREPFPENVVLLEIDERSLAKYGQFPFQRGIYARLIDILSESKAKGLGFDMLFAEPNNGSLISELNALAQQIPSAQAKGAIEEKIKKLDGDTILEGKLKENRLPVVLGYILLSGSETNLTEAEWDIFASKNKTAYVQSFSQREDAEISTAIDFDAIMAPMAKFWLKSEARSGFFNANFDREAVLRKVALLGKFNDTYLPSLALGSAMAHDNLNPIDIKVTQADAGFLRIKYPGWKKEKTINPDGTFYLRFYGKDHSIKHIELADLLDGEAKAKKEARAAVKNSIVLLGATAAGLNDIRSTPFGDKFPGTEIVATATANIIHGSFLERMPAWYQNFILWIFIWAVAIALMAHFLPIYLSIICLAGSGYALDAYAQKQFESSWLMPVLPFLLQLSISFLLILIFRYIASEKDKRFVKQAFSRYVSGDVVKEILRDKEKLKLGGERRELTVLFSDLAGFTKISEKLSADKLSKLLNELFTELTATVLNHHGTLDKYMGDAIMCFWGAPLPKADHAEAACHAALEMYEALQKVNLKWQKEHGISIDMRIGINTGEMSVGNMGSEQLFNYTVLGDNVNLGSRLESINSYYGTHIILGENTARKVQGKFPLRLLDRVAVKGKDKPVEIYELLAQRQAGSWQNAYSEALQAYFRGDFSQAKQKFSSVLLEKPQDDASKLFLARMEELGSAPKDWDGVWRMSSK